MRRSSFRFSLPLLAVVILAGAVAWFVWQKHSLPVSSKPAQPSQEQRPSQLSALGEPPDWSTLEAFQRSITRSEFERLLTTVFTSGGAWRKFIEINDSAAHIRTSNDAAAPHFILQFSKSPSPQAAPRDWKTAAELPPATPEEPLSGLHIAIDPGHIGGQWAKIEERWLLVGTGPPICEGDMTLQVAKLLKSRLTTLGATVTLVRKTGEPVTPLRPESLLSLAQDSSTPDDSPAALQKLARRLFYRTAEIHARAKLVNQSIKPDLVLCLHFNADPWGNPNRPTLVERSHLHLLLNGAYTDEEISLLDQRFAMLKKLLGRTHEEEARIAATVATTFAEITGLPPFIYPADSPNAITVNGHPYLWLRNLLANRLYDCPVIFMEPYVMNSTLDHPRLQAGDFNGTRKINGKNQASIFREYADALTAALVKYYSENRTLAQPSK